MAWGLDRGTLEAGRDEKAAGVAAGPLHHPLEELGRAHRWLDEEVEARRRFAEAAAALETSIEARGRGDALSRGRTGGLLLQAGEREAARGWFERALESLDVASPRDANHVAALRYLLGDPDATLVAAALAEEPDPILEPIVELGDARALRAGEGRRPRRRPGLAAAARAPRAAAHDARRRGGGGDGRGRRRQRRRLSGRSAPGHRADGPADQGVRRVPRADRVGRRRGGLVRAGPRSPHPGFRTGVDAAADWLRAHAPDPPGGDWAAVTLRALAAAAYD